MNLNSDFKKSINMEEALDADMQVLMAIKEYRLQSLGEFAVDVIVDRLNIEPFYDFLRTFNHSNDLPYHNFYHSTSVLLNCYEGAWHTGLNDEEIRGLCIGALLHDFNHSGGELADEENIYLALKGLSSAQAYAKSMLIGLSPESLKIAESVIRVTQYPFILEPDTFVKQIVRDADLMQPYEEIPCVLVNQYLGLKVEVEIQKNTKFSDKEFADGLKIWQNKEVDWHTEWALDKSKVRNWEMVKSDLYYLLIGDHRVCH